VADLPFGHQVGEEPELLVGPYRRVDPVDPDAVDAAVTARTAAVVPVHLFGHPAPMDRITEVASRHGLAVVEDAAQAHAASWDGRPTGSWGTAAAFSFYATKNMTTGEGGMIVLGDEVQARTARLLRNQGMETQYANEIVGYNMRMTDMAAAIGVVQIGRLAGFTEHRRANARILDEALGHLVAVPAVHDRAVHVYHQYTIRAEDRDLLGRRLEHRGVEARVFYPTPVHRLPAFDVRADLPETDRAARQVLSLPVGPHVSPEDARVVADTVAEVVGPSGGSPT